MNFDEKHSPNVLGNQNRLQNSADTTTKSLIFCLLWPLFEKNPSSINQDIKKNLPEAELKATNPVIWSHGFPAVILLRMILISPEAKKLVRTAKTDLQADLSIPLSHRSYCPKSFF